MLSAFGISPLTLTLSPEGRGDAGGDAGAQKRTRGSKLQPRQVVLARKLRADFTDAENRLWYHLRDRRLNGFKFVRQYPIDRYVADFVCRDSMLVIEADGGQHNPERDQNRDETIQFAGYLILRFWNHDILSDTDAVLEQILNTLASCVPSPLRGEGQGEGLPSQQIDYE